MEMPSARTAPPTRDLLSCRLPSPSSALFPAHPPYPCSDWYRVNLAPSARRGVSCQPGAKCS